LGIAAISVDRTLRECAFGLGCWHTAVL
jgi:hypothetical protein